MQKSNTLVSTGVTYLEKRGRLERKKAPDAKCEKVEESVSGVSQSTMSAILNFCAFAGLLFGFLTAVSPPKYSKCISKDFGHGGTVARWHGLRLFRTVLRFVHLGRTIVCSGICRVHELESR